MANRLPSWTRWDTLILVALVLVAAGLRFPRLAEPNTIVFDETYYAKDACLYLGHDKAFCNTAQETEQSYVHPPLGKWLIGLGIQAFGYNPFGWRVAAAIFGVGVAALAFLLARYLFGDRLTGAVAGFLVATDFLLIVQSRVAMLDIFLAFFVLLGFLFLAFDRQRILLLTGAVLPSSGKRTAARRGRWRFAAGLAFGLAIAVKWSGIWALIAAGILAVAWSVGLAREWGVKSDAASRAGVLSRELSMSVLALAVVPLCFYLLSYFSWWTENSYNIQAFTDLQQRMFEYHATLKATHAYQAKAWTWPLVLRPVAYYYEAEPNPTHVLALGNPATWWASIAVGVWMLVRSVRRWRAERLVAMGWAGQYIPWLFFGRPALFFFYMTPIVPFMMIGLAWALRKIWGVGKLGRWVVAVYLLGVVVSLAWFYPVLSGISLPYESWRWRMWLPGWI
jgi:dolichyl-phosphate-mannose-protein mannosyltransferase